MPLLFASLPTLVNHALVMAIAQAEELATYPRNIAAEISATARALFSTDAAATVQAAIPSRDTVIG
jgi:hypothetical protein